MRQIFSAITLPWIILTLSLCLSIALFQETRNLIRAKEQAYFERETSKIKENIVNHLQEYEAVLRGAQGLFAASKSVEYNEWRSFVQALDVEKNYPGLIAIGFTAVVAKKDKARFVREARNNGSPDFHIWPEENRDDAFVNLYVEPTKMGRSVIGFDLSSDIKRKSALEKARDTGQFAITAKILLRNIDNADKTGFLMAIPIYKNGLPRETVAERQRNLAGWIVAALQTQVLMADITDETDAEIDFEIFDGTILNAESVLYDDDQILHAIDGSYHPSFEEQSFLETSGRTWTLYFSTYPTFGRAMDKSLPPLVLASGAVMSLLLFALIRSLLRTRQAAQTLAEHMTKDLRASEIKYRNLFEYAGDSIFIIEPESRRILDANEKAASHLGYTREELLKLRVDDIDAPKFAAKNEELASQALRNGSVIFEHVQKHKSGSEIPVEINCRVVDYDGKPALQGFVRDISERKKIEKMKNEFISMVSHELRTPLTSIRGSIGLIAGGATGPVPEEAKPLLDIALNDCERLVRLINDILDIEKIESGRMDFKMRPVALMPLLKRAIDTNRPFAGQLKVTLHLSQKAPDVIVNADPDRLIQVITNLLSNAAKFSPQGEQVEIVVTMEGGRVRIAVTDHGPGIPENFQPHLFEKFAQEDSSDSRQKGGTGLGLNISKSILEKMNGRIAFQTKRNEGTTFYFDLPAVPQLILSEEKILPALSLSAQQTTNKPRVLLYVEDDNNTYEVVSRILRDTAWICRATTVEEAKRQLERDHFDLMILDLTLPDGCGLDLLPLVTKEVRPTPVIVFSVDELSRESASHVAASLIKSQTSNEELIQTVKSLLNKNEWGGVSCPA